MKYLLPLLLTLLCLTTACNEETALLNDLNGNWDITNVEFIGTDGNRIPTTLAAATLTIGDCDLDTNRNTDDCPGSLTTTDGTTAPAEYRVTTAGDERFLDLVIDPDGIDASDRPLLYRMLTLNFAVTLNGDQLQLIPTSQPVLRDANGETVRFTSAVIDAERR